MEITVYNENTGKIIKTLTGAVDTKRVLKKNQAYIEGIYPMTGYIHRGKYIKKQYIHPDCSADSISEALDYAKKGRKTCIKALQNVGMSESEAEKYLEKNYHIPRAKTYPPIHEFIDAEVKIHSDDPDLQKQGEEQKKQYLENCLKVKAEFPKKENKS